MVNCLIWFVNRLERRFYCHFSGVEHRTGNAMHYTQIKKSDLNFEPLAEFIVEDGDGWISH